VLSETRPEFVYVDLAILVAARSVAVHPEEEAARVSEILRDTARRARSSKAKSSSTKCWHSDGCPALRLIVIIDMKGCGISATRAA